jgi:hypothetical protein
MHLQGGMALDGAEWGRGRTARGTLKVYPADVQMIWTAAIRSATL